MIPSSTTEALREETQGVAVGHIRQRDDYFLYPQLFHLGQTLTDHFWRSQQATRALADWSGA